MARASHYWLIPQRVKFEAVKHISKPFWGVQFHPERTTIKAESHPEGHRVIENFFGIIKR